jgi:hypothetical protein
MRSSGRVEMGGGGWAGQQKLAVDGAAAETEIGTGMGTGTEM